MKKGNNREISSISRTYSSGSGKNRRSITETISFLPSKQKKVDTHVLFGALSIVLSLLLILRVGGVILGTSTNLSFSSLLSALERINTIDITWIGTLSEKTRISVDLPILQTLINVIITPIQVMLFLGTSALNLIWILLNFIGIAFGVPV